jgi:hypothetical protein
VIDTTGEGQIMFDTRYLAVTPLEESIDIEKKVDQDIITIKLIS